MTGTQTSTPLVALHLSDIHFGQEKGEDVQINEDARDQLVIKVRDIAKDRAAAKQAPIGGIIVTGDIAYAGKKSQFEDAAVWLKEICEAAGCDPLSVQVVPGNHDIDRGDSVMVSSLIRDLLAKGRGLLDKVLGSTGDRSALYKRFDAYQEFANGYGCVLDTEGGNAGLKVHTFAQGKNLRLLGLNSALLCCGDETDKDPRLLLGARQRIIKEAPDAEYAILIHHPMRWLEDGDDTWKYIDNRARILMCGHEHRSNVTLRKTESGCEVLVIDAGATVPDEVTSEFTYTFNVIDIDLSKGGDAMEVTVDSYIWVDGGLRFEQDATNHQDGKPRVYTLPCPKFGYARASATSMPSPTSDAAADGPGQVEEEAPIEAIDLASLPPSVSGGARSLAQARSDFFHNLSIQQRLEVLVRLKALPEGDEFNQNIMMRQLDRLNKAGRLDELTAAIEEAQKGA